MRQRKKITEKMRRRNLLWTMGIVEGVSLYAGLHLGYCYRALPDDGERTIFKAAMLASEHLSEHPFQMFPADPLMVGICLVAGMLGCLYFYNEYLKVKDTVEDVHGDAAFEEDYREYDKEFVMEPEAVYVARNGRGHVETRVMSMDGGEDVSVKLLSERNDRERWLKKNAPYNEEHKRVLRRYPKKQEAERVRLMAQIYSKRVFLSLNGRWTQRNMNALIFGASGAGKSRFFLLPNLLQANSSYMVTDPSGDVMPKVGDFLLRRNYLLKCFSVVDMKHSCRFNPLYYIREEEDIPVMVKCLMDNTSGWKKNMTGDSNFWTMTTQALLCGTIAYLYEVLPIEQRNFYNVLEILRMDERDEFSDPEGETDFDALFRKLGDANPNSYAYNQYVTYKQAPAKTALNILISTSVLLSEYVDMAGFKNLTYKDEMELDRLGQERMAIFLNIPQGDTTYAWISSMLFAVTFRILKKQGEERMKKEGLGDPELKVPVRFLLDECRNIGRIPDLEGYLSFCRKYRISIVPIFQSFSQLEELYGKGTANEFLSNCDTMVFLGGRDPATLKIICDEMGKATVKVLSYSNSKGRGASNSVSKQQVGMELMSRVQMSQMSNLECLVFVRGLRPFKDEKYHLEEHPNYRYLAEGDLGKPLMDPFTIAYDDDEIEGVRIKASDEEGYIEPTIVDSARRRALVAKYRKKVAELSVQLDVLQVKLAEAISQKRGTERLEANIGRVKAMIKWFGRLEVPEDNDKDDSQSHRMTEGERIKGIRYVGSFAPDYEFDEADGDAVEEMFEKMKKNAGNTEYSDVE